MVYVMVIGFMSLLMGFLLLSSANLYSMFRRAQLPPSNSVLLPFYMFEYCVYKMFSVPSVSLPGRSLISYLNSIVSINPMDLE